MCHALTRNQQIYVICLFVGLDKNGSVYNEGIPVRTDEVTSQ